MRSLAGAVGAVFAGVAAIVVPAWDWPTPELNTAVGFGQTLEYGELSTGVLLGGSGNEVFAAHEGELIYRAEVGNRTPGQLTHPLGNYIVAEHGRSFRAIYGHFAELADFEGGPQLNEEVSLGTVGASGYSAEPGVLLQIRDQERDAYVNPYVMLPQRSDQTAPVAQGLYIASDADDGAPEPIGSVDSLPSGSISFYVEAYDLSVVGGIRRRVAPFRIDLLVDGEAADTIEFETVTASRSALLLGGRVPAGRATAGNWQLYAGAVELAPGTYPVAVTISDYAGNSTEIGGSVTVGSAE